MTDMPRRTAVLSLAAVAAAPAILPGAARAAAVAPASNDDAGDVIHWNNHVYRIHLRAEDTGGALGAVVTDFPYREAPPMHVHHDADELFHVVSGEIVIEVAGVRRTVRQGETAFAPRGAAHGFVVTSPEGASVFVAYTPGGFEGFFAAVEGLEIPADLPRIKEIGVGFALEIVGPPMALEG